MPPHDNIMAVHRLLEEGFGGGDLSVVDELVSADFIEHQNGAQGVGPDAVKRIIRGLHESFTELRLTVEALSASEDTVWVRSRATATNTKPFMGRPPSGKPIAIDVIDVIRFRGATMVEHWGVADRLGMIQQLGLMGDVTGRAA